MKLGEIFTGRSQELMRFIKKEEAESLPAETLDGQKIVWDYVEAPTETAFEGTGVALGRIIFKENTDI